MNHAKKRPWPAGPAVLALLIASAALGLFPSCLSGPSATPEKPPVQASKPEASPAPSPVASPVVAQVNPPPAIPKLIPQVSGTRHRPLPGSVLVLNLPEPGLPPLALAPALVPTPPVAAKVPEPSPAPVAPKPLEAVAKAPPPPAPVVPAKPAPKLEAPKPAPAKPAEASLQAGPSLPPPGPASTIQALSAQADRKPDIARNITVDLGQRIELPFEGSGWTYLGETEGREGILYESRRYEGPGLTFVLNTNKTGSFVLRFQREDLLRGTTNEELVAVQVSPKPQKPTTPSPVAASPTPVTPAAPASEAAPVKPVPPATPAPVAATPSPSIMALPAAQGSSSFAASLPNSPEGLLLAARTELLAGRLPTSLAALDRFLSLYPEGMDEAYYLYGLALEQNGDTKDIKKAYAAYKKVVDTWPESQYWDQVKARMAFLERHYFTIR